MQVPYVVASIVLLALLVMIKKSYRIISKVLSKIEKSGNQTGPIIRIGRKK